MNEAVATNSSEQSPTDSSTAQPEAPGSILAQPPTDDALLKPEDKPAEAEASKPNGEFVPVTEADIKLPEGFEAPGDAMKNFIGIMNDQELTPAQRAQKLVDFQTDMMRQQQEDLIKAYNDQAEEWKTQARALPEFGGDKLEQTIRDVDGMVRSLLPDKAEYDSFYQGLVVTGFANHPMAIKLFALAAKALAEPTPAKAGGATSADNGLGSIYTTMVRDKD